MSLTIQSAASPGWVMFGALSAWLRCLSARFQECPQSSGRFKSDRSYCMLNDVRGKCPHSILLDRLFYMRPILSLYFSPTKSSLKEHNPCFSTPSFLVACSFCSLQIKDSFVNFDLDPKSRLFYMADESDIVTHELLNLRCPRSILPG